MRQLSTDDLTITAAAMMAALLVGLQPAAASQVLSADTLRQNIPGARINLDTPLGSVVPVRYGEDGSLEGTAGAVAFFLGAARDSGRWWIEGGRLCHKWKVWFNGHTKCFRIRLNPGNRVEWSEEGGDSGTGTIVALGKPPQPSASSPRIVADAARSAGRPQPPMRVAAPPRKPDRTNTEAAQPAPLPEPAPRAAGKTWPTSVTRTVVPPPPGRTQTVSSASGAVAVSPRAVTKPPVPAAAPGQLQAYRVINVAQDDVLNMRRGPSASTDIVATIPPRAVGVRLSGRCVGEWCPVEFRRTAGWVHRFFLAPANGSRTYAQVQDWRYVVKYRVVGVAAADVLNVRRRADPEADIVATIPAAGRGVRMTGYCLADWCPVAHARSSGWVNRQYLALDY